MVKSGEYLVFETPLGWMGAAATVKGLAAVVLPRQNIEDVYSSIWLAGYDLARAENSLLNDFTLAVTDYFGDRPVTFDNFEIDWDWATPFQATVLREVRYIPYGQTRSYKEVALMTGNPQGARAVGGALKSNNIPLVIPCHRVIAANGGLGGFTGASLDVKKQLIEMERKKLINGQIMR